MLNKVSITATGQQLYFVADRDSRTRNGPVTVTKLGRVWANLSNNLRASIEDATIESNAYGSPGHLVENQKVYEDARNTRIAFDALRKEIGHGTQPGVTASDIRQAAALLKIELP